MSRRRRQDPGRPVVISVVSDIHAGSTVGLCPADGVDLDDGGRYEPSRAQRWLWQCWLEYWDEVARERDAIGADLYVVVNGDVIEGQHHDTTQVVSNNLDVQAAVARACLEVPQALSPDCWFVVRGTEAHAGPSAQSEEAIARWLGAERDQDTGTWSWWQLRMIVHDLLIDIAHHGRMGNRAHTRWNIVQLLAADIALEHLQSRERPPDLVIRSHHHKYADSHDAQPVRVIQTPAWQLKTAYAHRKATESLADIGGIIVTIRDGALSVRPMLYRPRRATPWQARST